MLRDLGVWLGHSSDRMVGEKSFKHVTVMIGSASWKNLSAYHQKSRFGGGDGEQRQGAL